MMMRVGDSLIGKMLSSGAIAGFTTALAASLAGKREAGSYAAPLNATSHVFWGDEAAQHDEASAKYTLTGVATNVASATFWAAIYEKLFGQQSGTEQSLLKPVLGALAVTAGAYVTDYYLVPKRLTPGYELRLSGKSLAAIYGALAVGLAAGGLMSRRSLP
ncbi:hypothetical protein [Noviherbaspirillum autotrophicum]|nr:hypothetical protein [Noviherbaspirillum autotrophicum]